MRILPRSRQQDYWTIVQSLSLGGLLRGFVFDHRAAAAPSTLDGLLEETLGASPWRSTPGATRPSPVHVSSQRCRSRSSAGA